MNCLFPFPLEKTKIRHPVIPVAFASSARQRVQPHTQMQASAAHSNIPRSVFLTSEYQGKRWIKSKIAKNTYDTICCPADMPMFLHWVHPGSL